MGCRDTGEESSKELVQTWTKKAYFVQGSVNPAWSSDYGHINNLHLTRARKKLRTEG